MRECKYCGVGGAYTNCVDSDDLATILGCYRRQLAAAQALNAEWEQKAANWMASPEAQQQLAGYRELSMGKLAAIEKAEALERQIAAANERVGRLRDMAYGVVNGTNPDEFTRGQAVMAAEILRIIGGA